MAEGRADDKLLHGFIVSGLFLLSPAADPLKIPAFTAGIFVIVWNYYEDFKM